MSFNQFIAIVKARWIVLAFVLLLTVLTTVVLSFVLPKQYTATASIVVDVKSPDPIVGMVLPGMMGASYMATQADIITSDRVSLKVVRGLGLGKNPQMVEQWRDEANGQGDIDAWLAALMQKNLKVLPSRESNVINVSYTAVDPNFAAAMVNAFVQAYLDTVVELRVAPARQYQVQFEAQAKTVREQLETAQNRLSAYQREKGLIATDERMDVENARLLELSSQLVSLQSLSADSVSRKAQVSANSAEVLANPVISALKADISRQEARHKELLAKLGSAHPQVVESQANISELRARIDAEISRVASSIGINNTVNLSREGQIRSALDQQRQKILKLKEQRDEAAVLFRDVENAQRAYDAIQARYNQTALESQTTQTNVSVLAQATPPLKASFPNIPLNIALAFVVGGMLAVGVAIAIEFLDRRLRSAEDVVDGLSLPLLGVLSRGGTAGAGWDALPPHGKLLSRRSLLELASPVRS